MSPQQIFKSNLLFLIVLQIWLILQAVTVIHQMSRCSWIRSRRWGSSKARSRGSGSAICTHKFAVITYLRKQEWIHIAVQSRINSVLPSNPSISVHIRESPTLLPPLPLIRGNFFCKGILRHKRSDRSTVLILLFAILLLVSLFVFITRRYSMLSNHCSFHIPLLG